MELREKLSRDLHDDLASTLGSISIYANMLNKGSESQGEGTARVSAKVAALTQNALQSITDIIWMTSPRNDTLQSLAGKIENYLFDLLSDNNIAFTSNIRLPDNPVILKEEVRNDAFLILKEATHNIIRHAGAANVDFRAETSGRTCTFLLNDDGIGIQASKVVAGRRSGGNGLENMRRRAGESGIDLTIRNADGGGTEVILSFGI
jgi:signal transduction histidine kinase